MPKTTSEYKYGVAHLAKALNIQDVSVRVGLRKHKVKKNKDGVYGWNSRAEFDKIVALWDEEKPAKKAPAKKTSKRTASTKKASEARAAA